MFLVTNKLKNSTGKESLLSATASLMPPLPVNCLCVGREYVSSTEI